MRISDWSSDVCSSDLISRTAVDRVVAATPFEPVGVRVAGQRVGKAAADHGLNSGKAVPLRVATRHGAGGKVDLHPRGAARIDRRIEPACAIDPVAARPAAENLVAAIADQRVRKAGPDETKSEEHTHELQ